MGFTKFQTTLLDIPSSVLQIVSLVGSGYIASVVKNSRAVMMVSIDRPSLSGVSYHAGSSSAIVPASSPRPASPTDLPMRGGGVWSPFGSHLSRVSDSHWCVGDSHHNVSPSDSYIDSRLSWSLRCGRYPPPPRAPTSNGPCRTWEAIRSVKSSRH